MTLLIGICIYLKIGARIILTFRKIKQGSLGKENMKCMWKVIYLHFSAEWEMYWRQKAKCSLARSLVRTSFHCRLRLVWILGNSFVQTGRRKGMVCEEGKGGQDFLIGTLSRKRPLRSWSRVWGLPSHNIHYTPKSTQEAPHHAQLP